MKRRNVQMAFIGEGSSGPDLSSLDALVDGDEAIDVAVRAGKLMVVVPAGTSDDQMFDAASLVGGELVLEDGRRLSFEIHDVADGAQYSVSESEQVDSHPGLSGLPNVPGGA